MDKIIALDIDDCILPCNMNYFGFTDDNIAILEINLKRLRMIVDKYEMKVFITSSWYAMLKLEDNKISLKYNIKDSQIHRILNLLKEYLDGYFIGLSCGNRRKDIEILSKNNKVVILDDMNLSSSENENCIYCETKGFIDGNIGYKIDKFLYDGTPN